MSDERRPEAVWVFPEEKKSSKGAVWLIVILSIVAIAIVGTLLYYLLPTGADDAEPTPTASSSATASATPSASPTPTATETPIVIPTPTFTPEPEETEQPAPEEPSVPDPDLGTFTTLVQPRLDDAATGLSIVAGQSGSDAAQVVDGLQLDAGALSGTPAPSSIAGAWADAVTTYASRLGELRAAYDNGSDPQPALDAAGAALQHVRAVAGL